MPDLSDVEIGDPIDALALTERASRVCASNGIRRVADLVSRKRSEVEGFVQMTPQILTELVKKVGETGLGFSGENPAVSPEEFLGQSLPLPIPPLLRDELSSFEAKPPTAPSPPKAAPPSPKAAPPPPKAAPPSVAASPPPKVATPKPPPARKTSPVSDPELRALVSDSISSHSGCTRALNALAAAGVMTLEQVASMTSEEFESIADLGERSSDRIKASLAARGVVLKKRSRDPLVVASTEVQAETPKQAERDRHADAEEKTKQAAGDSEAFGVNALRELIERRVSAGDWDKIVDRAVGLAIRGDPHARDWLSRAGGYL